MVALVRWSIFLLIAGLGAFYVLTMPRGVDEARFAGLTGDANRGASAFHAAGCASCHTAPKTDFSTEPVLEGGRQFPSDFGTFIAPNISPSTTQGIGGWSLVEFANAVKRGISPDGAHYYPVFPYTAYARMADQDIADLKAFIDALPASDTPSQAHDVGFPFSIRRTLGAWKILFAGTDWVLQDADTPELIRGRYLVEAQAHCAECHTPRNVLGGLKTDAWMTGAVVPGEGKVPGIDPTSLDWAEKDIAFYLETGFTPDFDSSGGAMVHVIENMSQLPAEDREAIAAYLKALAK
ncbi:cytochrome c [Cognatishimia maritima]|uniref:Cytochrome c, mono-and diheme variants n=1 Tax=Cognatishimia maritima TaxID=870908 RepID=A0A1M5I7W3_9RHOB|nr:cytochrome c [Cognatishimia maritima]SHG24488.1 Cytochrome c, mono-and diheme variants [Cognatishimia maritima]